MKWIFLFVFQLFFSIEYCIAQEPFLTNFNSDSFKNISAWDKNIVALKGEILRIEIGYQDKPYFLIQMEDSATIWTGFLLNTNNDDILLQDSVKVLGYISKVAFDDELAKEFNKTDYQLLCFAIYNMRTKKLLYHPGGVEQVKEWFNGKIPKVKF